MRRALGIVAYADVGCAVYSTERRRATSVDEMPLGGLIVAVTEKVDRETGEVERAFLTFDHHATRPLVRWDLLAEREVDKKMIEAVDMSVLAKAWRRLAEDIAFSAPHRYRKGPATPGEVRAARAVLNLQEVVFGPGGDLFGGLDRPTAPAEPVVPRPNARPNTAALID